MSLEVDLITPERLFFHEPAAESVLVPTTQGQLGIFSGHAPLMSLVGMGELRVRTPEAEESIAVYGGIVRICCDHITLLVDSAEFAYDLDPETTYLARLVAETDLQSNACPETRLALQRAKLRERLARRVQQLEAPRLHSVPLDENGLPKIAPMVPRLPIELDAPHYKPDSESGQDSPFG